jgi:tetratricopeptide (TPR) repeat protein
MLKTAENYFDDGCYQDTVNDDMRTAIECYTEAIRLNPEYAEAFFNRAVDYEQIGDLPRAVADYRRYTELRPDEPTGHDYLARAILDADDPALRDVPLALKHAEQACRLAEESNCWPLNTLAAAYAESSRYADAIAFQERAVHLASQDREASDFFVTRMKENLARYQDKHRTNKPWWRFW